MQSPDLVITGGLSTGLHSSQPVCYHCGSDTELFIAFLNTRFCVACVAKLLTHVSDGLKQGVATRV
jgi:uncharacterized protein (DUF983 family)